MFQKAVDDNDISSDPVCYFIKNDILMQKWRPPDISVEDEWAVKCQVVIPKIYRSQVLSLANESPMSGHLGVNKMYAKVSSHFCLPDLMKDVVQFCTSCHTCQMVGKPNQSLPKAPLQPFSRILVDCVGPLPKNKSGNQYLPTITCASTRLIKALIKLFLLVGLPKSIQSYQGSDFMSSIFQQVTCELGVKQFRSTAYHPESQGALERFHQTLKIMINAYCSETEEDWDEGIYLQLESQYKSV